jgi:hypothetical protein
MSALKKFSLLIITLSLMLGALGATAYPAEASQTGVVNCRLWHTVKNGETLTTIAVRYETNWRRIAELNDVQSSSDLYSGQKLCIFSTSSNYSPSPLSFSLSQAELSQRVYASSVEEDKYVTLVGKNLYSNTRYNVFLSWLGNRITQAIPVGSVLTDNAGSFTGTYKIPKILADRLKISIYLTSGAGDSASNWFINATAKGSTGGVGMGTPTLSVTDAKKGQVQIKIANLPAQVPFEVYIGKASSKGIGGVLVGTVKDDDGGGLKATFDIPSSLSDRSKLDIRLENKPLGLSAYMTFDN